MGCAHRSAPLRDMKSLEIPFYILTLFPFSSNLKLGVGGLLAFF
jgi:hypothetical protein